MCGCRSRSPASPRAGCRWSISTRSAARTNWCSTARRSRSTPISRSRRNCRRSRRASPRCAGPRARDGWRCTGPVAPLLEGDKGDYAACVLGLRDYVRKNGFPGVLLGVSGGIDSALCAAIAVDALGADQVRGVMLPFRFTAQVSLDDAAKLAKALGIRYEVLPIADAVNGFEKILSGTVRGPAARHHRGKSAGAHPRHAVDGDFQQDRRDGGHDRQQVGNVGRLRHALWRHERRLQSDQGHLQDRSVPAVEPAQRLEAGRRARARRAR